MYDITSIDSFNQVKSWLDELRRHSRTLSSKLLFHFLHLENLFFVHTAEDCKIMLVGNKCDQNSTRSVSTEAGKAFAKANSLFFFETSALTGESVYAAFAHLVLHIFGGPHAKRTNSSSSGNGGDFDNVMAKVNHQSSAEDLVAPMNVAAADHIVEKNVVQEGKIDLSQAGGNKGGAVKKAQCC